MSERHALDLARADLCFAIEYCCGFSAPYVKRLWGTVEFITKTLGDKEEFSIRLKTWGQKCPGCQGEDYLNKCYLHNEHYRE